MTSPLLSLTEAEKMTATEKPAAPTACVVRPVFCPRCNHWLAECWGQWRGVLRVRCPRCKRNVYYLAAEDSTLSTD